LADERAGSLQAQARRFDVRTKKSGRAAKGSASARAEIVTEHGMKSDAVFKKTFNAVLDYVLASQTSTLSPSENQLADMFDVSRTTIRKILSALAAKGLVARTGSQMQVLRSPDSADYFARADTVATSDRVEKKFMEWMLRGDRRPGDYINSLELARNFDVSTSAIREYLNRFHRFGLVEKRPNSGWIFRGFTVDFALELFEVRQLFEIRSAKAFARQPPDSEAWNQLRDLESEHLALAAQLSRRYHDFSELDERFHRLINDASRNRFMADFYDIISLIFHYHYQWRKVDEKERNAVAIREHLNYIDALYSGNAARVEAACRLHLLSARKTLIASIS
jgi:DNA-binding GntR family transcriptional regulator